ncbi:uncharacterized protein LOC123300637 [Chrysoperla carnea]|uniref:uncharacterized protein LOC123300637 n=1 Tax=Chrysoperla carnea TaxID=189513 RepID=UPI001D086883|nr:uncharacterized protein LOC123300637 [Chrysoperla carnea]
MKYLIVIFALISFSNAGFIINKSKSKSDMSKIRYGCLKSTNYPLEDALKVEKGELTGSDEEMHYMLCYAVKLGFANENGTFIENEFLNRLTEDVKKLEVKKFLDECSTVSDETPAKTIYLQAACLFDKGGEKLKSVNE